MGFLPLWDSDFRFLPFPFYSSRRQCRITHIKFQPKAPDEYQDHIPSSPPQNRHLHNRKRHAWTSQCYIRRPSHNPHRRRSLTPRCGPQRRHCNLFLLPILTDCTSVHTPIAIHRWRLTECFDCVSTKSSQEPTRTCDTGRGNRRGGESGGASVLAVGRGRIEAGGRKVESRGPGWTGSFGVL